MPKCETLHLKHYIATDLKSIYCKILGYVRKLSFLIQECSFENLIATLCFIFTLKFNAKLLDDSSWFNAYEHCLDKLFGKFFEKFSNVRVIPSELSM